MLNKFNNEFFFWGRYLIFVFKYLIVVILFIVDLFVIRVFYLYFIKKCGIVICK